jgi:hypothetical protein
VLGPSATGKPRKALTLDDFLRVLLSFCLYEDGQLSDLSFFCFDKDNSGVLDREELDWLTHQLMRASKRDAALGHEIQTELNK